MPPVLPPPIGDLNIRSSKSNDYIALTETEALAGSEPNMAPRLVARDGDNSVPVDGGSGTVDPHDINMQGIMALFAIICATFVIGAIWFFFWAKNGGFVWRKGDWEDYKSTVLRRKGADGKTLSNATESTNLGGGSVVEKGYQDDDETMTHTMTEPMTESVGMTAESESVAYEKPKRSKGKKKGFAETAKEKLMRTRRDEKWEGEGDEDMRAYRHEKPARVGGMNREFEGTYHGSNTEYSATSAPSEWSHSDITQARDHAAAGPSSRPRGCHIRSVSEFSFDGNEEEEALSTITEEHRLRDSGTSNRHHHTPNDHPRSSARSHPRQTHRSSRPDSRPRQSSPSKRRPRDSMPGSYTDPLDLSSTASSGYQYSHIDGSDTGTGTKSYRHPIPGLSNKGYRRAAGGSSGQLRSGRRRRDSLSDSEGEDESRL